MLLPLMCSQPHESTQRTVMLIMPSKQPNSHQFADELSAVPLCTRNRLQMAACAPPPCPPPSAPRPPPFLLLLRHDTLRVCVVSFSLQLRRWLVGRTHARRRAKRRLVRHIAAVTVQSAARATSARARCSALRSARLHRWMDRVAVLYADAFGVGGDEGDYSPSPAAMELLRDNNAPPTPYLPAAPPPIPASEQHAAIDAAPARGGGASTGGGRALAEALAPRMGRPPPGCPAALDINWGEWGVGLRLAFPPSPRVG